jgi:hypothetical protein
MEKALKGSVGAKKASFSILTGTDSNTTTSGGNKRYNTARNVRSYCAKAPARNRRGFFSQTARRAVFFTLYQIHQKYQTLVKYIGIMFTSVRIYIRVKEGSLNGWNFCM